MSITLIILIVTIFVSVSSFYRVELFDLLKFNAYQINQNREVWRFFSSGFVHTGWLHLGVNMYVFWMFGHEVEKYFRIFVGTELYRLIYLLFYITSLPMSTIYSFEKNKHNFWYNSVGASGAVSAVVFAYIIINPFHSLYLIFLPIPIPAIVFGLIYVIYSYYMSKKGDDNIGHDAHLFGSIYGFLFMVILKPSLLPALISKLSYALGF